MKKIILTLASFSMLLLTGCTRTHQPNYTKLVPKDEVYFNIAVGYEDFKIGENRFKVIYNGYVSNSQNDVMRFLHKRAEQLCKEHGFDAQEYSNTNIIKDDVYAGNVRYVYSADVLCINK
jgi:hypothetical protein